MNSKYTQITWYGNINKIIVLGVLLSIPVIFFGYYLWWRYLLVQILVYVVIGLVCIGLLSLLVRWVIRSTNIKRFPRRNREFNSLIWELNTLKSINRERSKQGLRRLVWDVGLEKEARCYWSTPAKCPHVVNACSLPHWTHPHDIRRSIWCSALSDGRIKSVGIVIHNDAHKSHIALAVK